MAKHKNDGKGFVSKGQRRSSMKAGKPVKAIMPSIGPVKTVMREAFEKVMPVNGFAGVARPSRGWTADVSRRTFEKLQSQGVFA